MKDLSYHFQIKNLKKELEIQKRINKNLARENKVLKSALIKINGISMRVLHDEAENGFDWRY